MKYIVAISAVIFTLLFVTLPVVWSDDDNGGRRWTGFGGNEHGFRRFANVRNPLYEEECGSCHMAYPPRLLPSASWEKIMAGLDDHFGDNAELEAETRQALSLFLRENSRTQMSGGRGRGFDGFGAAGDAPLRISETPHFVREHDRIPARMVKDNPKVLSFSNCNACHTRAEQGSFSEHDVQIPGFDNWEG